MYGQVAVCLKQTTTSAFPLILIKKGKEKLIESKSNIICWRTRYRLTKKGKIKIYLLQKKPVK